MRFMNGWSRAALLAAPMGLVLEIVDMIVEYNEAVSGVAAGAGGPQ